MFYSEERPAEAEETVSPVPGDTTEPAKPAPTQGRDNLPRAEEVVEEFSFVSSKGRRYRILRTRDRDVYDPPEQEPTDESKPVEETNSEQPEE